MQAGAGERCLTMSERISDRYKAASERVDHGRYSSSHRSRFS